MIDVSSRSPAAPNTSADLQPMAGVLSESLELLRQAGVGPAQLELGHKGWEALLQECVALCLRDAKAAAEPIRTLHQFACTGGTLISKCIAAMPNVQLLSEVDPLAPSPGLNDPKPRFTPSDMPTLLRASTRGASQELIVRVFQAEIRVVHEHAVRCGLRLVVRDHAHTQYCTGESVTNRPTLRQMVSAVASVRSLVTVRHPVDSFSSLLSNGWVHFAPSNFDAYCQRYLQFLDDHVDVPIVRYEDLVAEPVVTMQRICVALDLPCRDDFDSLISVFKVSGDSGRTGSGISTRPRRERAESLLTEAMGLSSYRLLASRLGYKALDVSSDAGA